ncbi:hypothetical protein BJ912DRAFT_527089 [Pholiota molesta]|nr:hypothetical protein BJ912DRAFT_527089 [Pholiota molesta]
MRLTPSEQSIIAFLFREAKQAFDEMQNKPDRGDTFYVTCEPGFRLPWSGHEVLQSIFQHHLATKLHTNQYVQVFRNDVYHPNHPYSGQHPVPHLQVFDPTTHEQYTKPTTEYPLVRIGYNGGGLPNIHKSHSKGPARTVISQVEGVHQFEGVISHNSFDPYNHYLATRFPF